MPKSIRPLNYFIALLFVALLLGGAYYLQIYMGINPCPLCMLQRITLGVLGCLFLLGILFSSKGFGRISIGLLCAFVSILGIILAGRQVWLQHSPANAGANCEASLSYMLSVLPFDEVIKRIFAGGAECARIDWQILHLSLAEWSLISFIVCLLFSLWQLRRG
ncbi:MAG: disulfide bond formation protein B [Gammaproteobacteria bacterium]